MQPLSGPQFPYIGNEKLGLVQVLKLGSTKPQVFFKSQGLGRRREAKGGPALRLLNCGWSLCLRILETCGQSYLQGPGLGGP